MAANTVNTIKYGITAVTTDGWEHQYSERLVEEKELLGVLAEYLVDFHFALVHLVVQREVHTRQTVQTPSQLPS